MLNDPRSHGLWESTAASGPETRALAGEAHADVAVIGAGFTGLSAALHLAEGGAAVIVLEAVDIGFGGSGRNVGLVNAGLWIMPDEVPKVLGKPYGERLLATLGGAPKLVFDLIERHGIECEVERTGTLHCAVGPEGLRAIAARAAQWQARGAPVRLLDAAEAARKIGSTAYAGALLDERAGTIQPLAYVRGLARAAIAAGARVFCESPVIQATRNDGRWTVRTTEGLVTADCILAATNAYTGPAPPRKSEAAGDLPWSGIGAELVPLPYFQFATAPLGHNLQASILPERQGAWDTKEILSSFRLDRAGRLIFGSVGALRGSGTAIHEAWARRAVCRLFPQLGPVSFEAGWYGRIGMTADSTPRFHRLAPNMMSFSGYNGRGIAPGTAFGRLLAQHILGQMTAEDMPLPITPTEPAKHRGLKGAYYEVGAQVAHLAAARF